MSVLRYCHFLSTLLFVLLITFAFFAEVAAVPPVTCNEVIFYSQNHEGGSDWTSPTNYDGPAQYELAWEYGSGTSYSGSQRWYIHNYGVTTEARLESPNITIPSTATNELFLRFYHAYNTDLGDDGGVVEVSVNSGSFTDVGVSNFTQNGYPRLFSGNGTVLGIREAFTGQSSNFPVYIESIVDLSMVAAPGDSIAIRFRFASDDTEAGDGWYVDDVQLGYCIASNTPTPTDTPSSTHTSTSTPTDTPSSTPTNTSTPTDTPSSTPTPTHTSVSTATTTPTFTESPTPTSTDTPSFTATVTPTFTETPTSTPTPTHIPVFTTTATPTFTESPTPTPTNTNPPGATATDTITPYPSPTENILPTSTPETTLDSVPPPPAPLAANVNDDPDSIVRIGMLDQMIADINVREIVVNGEYPEWLGRDITNAGFIGIQGVLDMGVRQAVDIFSPTGLRYFDGGIVVCLRGEGTLIYLNAKNAPRIAEIVGSYTVPEFPGFTCVTLFEPGTLVLVDPI